MLLLCCRRNIKFGVPFILLEEKVDNFSKFHKKNQKKKQKKYAVSFSFFSIFQSYKNGTSTYL